MTGDENGKESHERNVADTCNFNNDNSNDCIDRVPFHVKHAQLRCLSVNAKI